MTYKLSDRPKWWLPSLFGWLTIIANILLFLIWFLYSVVLLFASNDEIALNVFEVNPIDSQYLLSFMLSEFIGITCYFICTVIWITLFFRISAMLANRLADMVWLRSSDENKMLILNKYKKVS